MADFQPFPKGAVPFHEAVWCQNLDDPSRRYVETILRSGGEWAIRRGRREFSSATVDSEQRAFAFTWTKRDGQPVRFRLDPVFPHSDLYARQFGLSRGSHQALSEAALHAWTIMKGSLYDRIASGEATVYARLSGPLEADVSSIPNDVWEHFDMSDWRRGIATCRTTRTQLFSVHVVDPRQRLAAVGCRSAEEEFEALRIEFERRHAQALPPMTRRETDLWAAARGLPRSFAREARSRIPESQKLKPGEKRRDRRE